MTQELELSEAEIPIEEPVAEEQPVEEVEASEQEPAEEEGVDVAALQARLEEVEQESAGRLADLRATRSKNAQRLALVEDRLGKLAEVASKPDTPAVAEPDKEEDPVAWLDYKRREDAQKLDAIVENMNEQKAEQEGIKELNSLMGAAKSAEADYLGRSGVAVDEYTAAVTQLREARVLQHQAAGATREDAMMRANVDEVEFVRSNLAAGTNPAQAAMDLYKQLGLSGNSKPEVPAAAPETSQKIEAAQKGTKMSGLGSTPGGGKGTTLSVEQLASMSDEEFNKIYDRIGESGWEKLNMGGRITLPAG